MKIFTSRATAALATAGLVLAPGLAFAHTGVDGHTHGLAQGFLHPVSGLDHVLAMVMVGVLAWRMGSAGMWPLPATFLVAMALGGALGMTGLALPAVEAMIALSVIVISLVVVFNGRIAPMAAIGLVGIFALFHGFAHGAELPAGAPALGYAAGFLAATALLHLSGLALGAGMDRLGAPTARVAGAATSVAGAVLLIGAL